ncbi:MAG TPA: hypothetical protein VEB20_09655 [Azospirillaceae bacterium]|nr:hypothetical protein [Azospirillaceae bacterium]
MAGERKNGQNPTNPENAGGPASDKDAERIRRQSERIREMERLMRAAAAFARGRSAG